MGFSLNTALPAAQAAAIVGTGSMFGGVTHTGSTAGAVTMGLRVVGRRSQHVRPIVGLLRAIACVVFPVGLLWVVIDPRRRSLQDIVFRTRVVYSRPPAG
jgi:uncharacterized RDD family membrane protein YckC